MACRKTVSLLPAFAQPYRVVRNETIQAYLSESRRMRMDALHWEETIRRYWKRFLAWLPELSTMVGEHYGLST